MNFLAHAYLSFDNKEILVGNLISDFVKGNKRFNYPENIQKGIILHRQIDRFTDGHVATKKAKEIFRPAYRLYSGAFIDIVYDHFLANDPDIFSETSLLEFSTKVYRVLDEYIDNLPGAFSRMLPFMKEQNWLYNYRDVSGIEKSFGGLVRRSRYLSESDTAVRLLQKNYGQLREQYNEFIHPVRQFARHMYDELIKPE